jgi:hypothetical protein
MPPRRLEIDGVGGYLCNLRHSSTMDVSVLAVRPIDDSKQKECFDRLFDYLLERKRYGVIGT